MTLVLNKSEMGHIYLTKREERGNGGFQSFMVHLQQHLDPDTGALQVSDLDIAKVQAMANHANGAGGFQGRLRKIFGRHFPSLFPGTMHDLFE